VTNRPLNINRIKNFRIKNGTQKESNLLWMGNIRRQAQEEKKLCHWNISDARTEKSISKKKEKMRGSRPYWNFWKVVFAGWLIRYPGKMLRIFGVPLGFLIVLIYNAVTK
jgi:hypothetical protein